jgi:hypothetical protein
MEIEQALFYTEKLLREEKEKNARLRKALEELADLYAQALA